MPDQETMKLAGLFLKTMGLILVIVFCLVYVFTNLFDEQKQVKIGNISVHERMAKEYFAYCLSKKDTLDEQGEALSKTFGDGTQMFDIVPNFEEMKYNQYLRDHAIASFYMNYRMQYVLPSEPSEIGFMKWVLKKQ